MCEQDGSSIYIVRAPPVFPFPLDKVGEDEQENFWRKGINCRGAPTQLLRGRCQASCELGFAWLIRVRTSDANTSYSHTLRAGPWRDGSPQMVRKVKQEPEKQLETCQAVAITKQLTNSRLSSST